MFIKHYNPNRMPGPKVEWSILEILMEIIQKFISQAIYHLQTAGKDSSPYDKCFSRNPAEKFKNAEIFKEP